MRKLLPSFSIDVLIKEGDIENLKEALNTLTPFEIADMISNKGTEERNCIFMALTNSVATDTFDFLSVEIQRSILQHLPSMQAASLLRSFTPDRRTAFLQDLPQETIDELVKLLPNEQRILTLALLGYPKETVGRLMTPDFIAVGEEWTVEEVLEHIRLYGHDCATLNDIFILNDHGKLLRNIKLKELLFVPKHCRIKEIQGPYVLTLSINDSYDEAINIFQKHHREALPVVDDEGNMLGIVTSNDVLKLAHQEVAKDLQQIGGMKPLSTPYFQTPFSTLIKKRAIWLSIFFVVGSLTGFLFNIFKDEIFKEVVLVFFIPLIITMGGNAGSQASALVVSSLALGEIKLDDWWRVIKREFFSGVVLGVVLGALGFARTSIFNRFTHLYGTYWFLISEIVCVSTILVVIWGTIAGAMLPLIFFRFKMDPAIASAPFISSIISVTGLAIYFLTALAFLKGTTL